MERRTLLATTATGTLPERTRLQPASSRRKFAVACRSIAEGTTGTRTQCARSSISWSTMPEAPAGASITRRSVSPGT
jgi:hypothetical protein